MAPTLTVPNVFVLNHYSIYIRTFYIKYYINKIKWRNTHQSNGHWKLVVAAVRRWHGGAANLIVRQFVVDGCSRWMCGVRFTWQIIYHFGAFKSLLRRIERLSLFSGHFFAYLNVFDQCVGHEFSITNVAFLKRLFRWRAVCWIENIWNCSKKIISFRWNFILFKK